MDDDTFAGKVVKLLAVGYGTFALLTLVGLYLAMIVYMVYKLIVICFC